MKADPEVQARIHELRVYLRRHRRAYRWLIWSPLSGGALFLFFPWYLAVLPLIGAFVVGTYYERRLYRDRDRIIPCLRCDKKRRYIVPFDDWVCGYCSKTHSYTYAPTRRTWLERCHCNAVVHSFICPGCREPIVFDDVKGDKPAWLPGYPAG